MLFIAFLIVEPRQPKALNRPLRGENIAFKNALFADRPAKGFKLNLLRRKFFAAVIPSETKPITLSSKKSVMDVVRPSMLSAISDTTSSSSSTNSKASPSPSEILLKNLFNELVISVSPSKEVHLSEFARVISDICYNNCIIYDGLIGISGLNKTAFTSAPSPFFNVSTAVFASSSLMIFCVFACSIAAVICSSV